MKQWEREALKHIQSSLRALRRARRALPIIEDEQVRKLDAAIEKATRYAAQASISIDMKCDVYDDDLI